MVSAHDRESARLSGLDAIVVALPLAALILIASSVPQYFFLAGLPTRDRIFEASQGAGILTASLALIGVALIAVRAHLGESGRWDRWAVLCARSVAVIVLVVAVYAFWYELTLHVRIPGPNSVQSAGISFGGQPWSERLRGILVACAGSVLGVVTLVAVSQLGRQRERAEQDKARRRSGLTNTCLPPGMFQ